MKNSATTHVQFSKTTVANLSQLQGGTIRSWSSIAIRAIKQQVLQDAERAQ